MSGYRPLSDAERVDWLRLAGTEHVGPISFFQLIDRFGSAREALAALPTLARRGGRAAGGPKIPSVAEAQAQLAALARAGGRWIGATEPDYPVLLREIADPPPLISTVGRGELLNQRSVAVVGARNASANGRRLARDLARDLAASGLIVVSGLARGIDAAAHDGALPATVAVVAGGADVVYPEENRSLQDRIGTEGLIVAEMPPGTIPQARHFPRRNRIISGLSLATVVVEAAERSGSLITARFAAEQGRDVFAVPGSPLDPRARGCNGLIREGATLVQGAEDVLEGLGRLADPAPKRALEPPPKYDEAEADKARSTVLGLLGPGPVAVDELIRQCHMSAPAVLAVLLEAELAGRLDRHPGNQVSLRYPSKL